ncbi:hypothetical protein FACS1894164_03870 [Spirochaetia bacterium]|nr:hypothetical protein FACS1894164_03870 [Spirochaetia bacterium]
MSKYSGVQKEHQLKNLVFDDYFDSKKFSWEQEIDNIDFIITNPKSRRELFALDGPGASVHYLWAEAKKETHDIFEMLTQLIITCKKTYDKGEYLAPPYIGCFDTARIAFVDFHVILPIFTETDFNWNTTPSNHESPDFQKALLKIKNLIGANIVIYTFGSDDREIKEFIKTHVGIAGNTGIKSPITKDNFVQIFIKWIKEVKPFINISKTEWIDFKQTGVLDCDFYRADLMSLDGNTITEKLKIILKNDNYKFQAVFGGRLFSSDIGFTDMGEAYKRFWNKYGRPPAQVYQQYIIDRRDLLVPENIREVKGSFFTPKIWADKSKEYLAEIFGSDWQEKYYVWDCAAGTGNLLAGLTNEYNVWASDIDEGNVETMQSLIDIDENLNLLPSHVFQFDFLNDGFDKLPVELKKIIDDPEKRKKLIVYINPPYAESGAGIGKGINKEGVVIAHTSHNIYLDSLGKASHELFAQFMARVHHLLPDSHLAVFATLKYVNSYNFQKFRKFFTAVYKKGFICKANTFDNVHGTFPIGFGIWEITDDKFPKSIQFDVFDTGGEKTGVKRFFNGERYINDWIRFVDNFKDPIGVLNSKGIDFQNNQGLWISTTKPTGGGSHFGISKKNLIEIAIYFSIRQVFEHTWLNDRDQFYYPNEGYNTDNEFQSDCLIFTLFHGQNRISSHDGINHWIPFTEKEVRAKEKFESNFMSDFLKECSFSAEAQAVFDAGCELWKYYHAKIKNNKTASVNASFYDIREFFQGRDEGGRMNTNSNDETYNNLLATLREKLRALTEKIKPRVYEYGFLKE